MLYPMACMYEHVRVSTMYAHGQDPHLTGPSVHAGAIYTMGTCHKGLLANLGSKDGAFGRCVGLVGRGGLRLRILADSAAATSGPG